MSRIVIDVSEQQLGSWEYWAKKLGFDLNDFIKRAVICYIFAKKQQELKDLKVKIHN